MSNTSKAHVWKKYSVVVVSLVLTLFPVLCGQVCYFIYMYVYIKKTNPKLPGVAKAMVAVWILLDVCV